MPPLKWRSFLFSSKTSDALLNSAGFIARSRSRMSLCTVDLEIPNFLAAALTVALFSIMYSASVSVRSSIKSFNISPPNT